MADLIKASKEGNVERVVELLKAGANVHAEDDYALRWASFNGQAKAVKLLLEAGVSVHAQNDFAIKIAFEKKQDLVIMLLLDYGADKTKMIDAVLWKCIEYNLINPRRVMVCLPVS